MFKLIKTASESFKRLRCCFRPKNMTIHNDKKAFTLMELIITVIIVGVMASIVLPNYGTTIEKTRVSEALEILSTLRKAQVSFFAQKNQFATNISQLDIDITPLSNFNAPVLIDPGNNFNLAVVSIQRNDGTYALTITANGAITCTGAICSKLQVGN